MFTSKLSVFKMYVKAQLSLPFDFRWNVILDNNRREIWQVSVSFKELVLVSIECSRGFYESSAYYHLQ